VVCASTNSRCWHVCYNVFQLASQLNSVSGRDQLLEKVQELAAAHPDTMKIEMRHAKDGDYSADLLVGDNHQLSIFWPSTLVTTAALINVLFNSPACLPTTTTAAEYA
jgi:hypothetical protein